MATKFDNHSMKRRGWSTQPALWEKLKPLAQQKRHEPTPAEAKLWHYVRGSKLNGKKFRRQHPIERFIVAFYCAQAKMVIEVDGDVHQYTIDEDAVRQEYLESVGLRVIRFTNDEVLQDVESVLNHILKTLYEAMPAGSPSPYTERGSGGEVKDLIQ